MEDGQCIRGLVNMIMDVILRHTEDSGEQHDIVYSNVNIKNCMETPIKKNKKVTGRILELELDVDISNFDIVARELDDSTTFLKRNISFYDRKQQILFNKLVYLSTHPKNIVDIDRLILIDRCLKSLNRIAVAEEHSRLIDMSFKCFMSIVFITVFILMVGVLI